MDVNVNNLYSFFSPFNFIRIALDQKRKPLVEASAVVQVPSPNEYSYKAFYHPRDKMSFLGTISNTVNNRVTNKLLEETVAELKTDIVSKERQLQVKTEQLQERNEYILQLEEQLRRVEATNQIPIPPESSNEQQRIETVNAEDENAGL